jgi:FkbM family methyltransferase
LAFGNEKLGRIYVINTLKSVLRNMPVVVPLWRYARRRISPRRHEIWENHSSQFVEYIKKITRSNRKAFFVKVGAHDGLSADPCGRVLLDNLNWSGILIEPVPSCFEKLKKNYPDASRFTLEQVAIGRERGKSTFYFVSDDAKAHLPDLPSHFDMLGSFSKQHIVSHLNGVLEPFIVGVELDVLSLSEVLSKNSVQHIDLLQIDTEGYDFEVLKSLDFNVIKPGAIYLEHRHLNPSNIEELSALLRNQGYSVLDCGNDYFARISENRTV